MKRVIVQLTGTLKAGKNIYTTGTVFDSKDGAFHKDVAIEAEKAISGKSKIMRLLPIPEEKEIDKGVKKKKDTPDPDANDAAGAGQNDK